MKKSGYENDRARPVDRQLAEVFQQIEALGGAWLDMDELLKWGKHHLSSSPKNIRRHVHLLQAQGKVEVRSGGPGSLVPTRVRIRQQDTVQTEETGSAKR